MQTTSSRRAHDHERIPDTPEARAHAREAERIRADLEAHGIVPGRVAPTLDNTGHVRLTFDQVDKLLNLAYDDFQPTKS